MAFGVETMKNFDSVRQCGSPRRHDAWLQTVTHRAFTHTPAVDRIWPSIFFVTNKRIYFNYYAKSRKRSVVDRRKSSASAAITQSGILFRCLSSEATAAEISSTFRRGLKPEYCAISVLEANLRLQFQFCFIQILFYFSYNYQKNIFSFCLSEMMMMMMITSCAACNGADTICPRPLQVVT